jgi:glycosyltransferase involved in cell wall biosynthesis
LACGRFPALRQVPGFVIPHGHYREQYPAQLSRRTARDTLRLAGDARVAAFVGQIRRYKNVPALITQFRRIEDPRDVLLIAGSPLEAALREELSAAARGDARVRLDLRFLSNAELEVYISAADLVVLPYSEVLNSGSAILALSLNRPVLVPRLGAFEELRSSVGEDWIWTYEGALTASELEHALQWAVSSPRASAAPLDSMDWDPVTHATIEAYIKILTRNREPAPARQWAAAPETSV